MALLRRSCAPSLTHQSFDLFTTNRHIPAEQIMAVHRDDYVILDPHTYIPEFPWHIVGWLYVQARLNGQHHAADESARRVAHNATTHAVRLLDRYFVARQVVADIVHIQTQPMAGPMHVEAPVSS